MTVFFSSERRLGDLGIDRAELVSGVAFVGMINGLFVQVIETGLAGLNAVVLLACAVGLGLAWRGRGARPGWLDAAAALAAGGLTVIPHEAAGWAALGVLGLRGVAGWRGEPAARAAAAVFLALALHQIGGRVLVHLTAAPLSAGEAMLTAALLGLLREDVMLAGNAVATGGHLLYVVSDCLSLNLVLQGLLCCFVVARAFRPVWRWSELWSWALLAGAMVAFNLARLVAVGWGPGLYHLLHEGAGRTAVELAGLALTLAIAGWPVRREMRGGAR